MVMIGITLRNILGVKMSKTWYLILKGRKKKDMDGEIFTFLVMLIFKVYLLIKYEFIVFTLSYPILAGFPRSYSLASVFQNIHITIPVK